MENMYIVTKELLKSNKAPANIFLRIYKNCFKNIGFGYMPSEIELKEEYSKFYIASKKIKSLEEATELLENSFKKEVFYEFIKKRKENPLRNILMSKRDKEYYGTIITDTEESDPLLNFRRFNIEIRKV